MTVSDPALLLAHLDQLPDGALSETDATIDGDSESVILHRDGETIRAWLNVCPHAGRRLDWAPGKFLRDKQGHLVCAVHGATFELRSGECIAGPCRGASMRAIDVEVRDGAVYLRADALRTSG